MNCYKVTIVTTNAAGGTTSSPNGRFVACVAGVLYVVCDFPSGVEKVVDPDSILKVEKLGIGYVGEVKP